jgi:hypothetical protein
MALVGRALHLLAHLLLLLLLLLLLQETLWPCPSPAPRL